MSVSLPFPGHIYGKHGNAITHDAPELTQDHADTMQCRSLLCDDGDASDVSLILVLSPGSRFDAITTAWLNMIVRELRQPGKSALLLSTDPDAEESIRDGLIERLSLDCVPATSMGRA